MKKRKNPEPRFLPICQKSNSRTFQGPIRRIYKQTYWFWKSRHRCREGEVLGEGVSPP